MSLKVRMILIIIAVSIPILVVIIQNSIYIKRAKTSKEGFEELARSAQFALELNDIVHVLQIERGTTALYVSSGGDSKAYDSLTVKYAHTDAAFADLDIWLKEDAADPNYRSKDRLHSYVKDHRNNLDWSTTTIQEEIAFYTKINNHLIDWIGETVYKSPQSAKYVWKTLFSFYLLIVSKEQAGIERALGSTYFASGKMSDEDFIWYYRERTLGEAFLETSADYLNEVDVTYSNLRHSNLYAILAKMRAEISRNQQNDPDTQKGLYWFANMTQYINQLQETNKRVGEEVISETQEGGASTKDNRTIVAGSVLIAIVLIIWPIIIILLIIIVRTIQKFYKRLQDESKQLNRGAVSAVTASPSEKYVSKF